MSEDRMCRDDIYINYKLQKTASQKADVFLTDDFWDCASQKMCFLEKSIRSKVHDVDDCAAFTNASSQGPGGTWAGPDKKQVFSRCDSRYS